MNPERWTPLHIELLILYATRGYVAHENSGAPAVDEYSRALAEIGLISECPLNKGRYKATDFGNAFLKAICMTPLPERRWVDSRTGEDVTP